MIIEIGNLVEGLLWIVIALAFAVSLVKRPQRRAKLIAAVNFLAFGVSDFVEMHTGAWWQPWWLLVWKGACVLVMLVQFLLYLRNQRRLRASASGSETDNTT